MRSSSRAIVLFFALAAEQAVAQSGAGGFNVGDTVQINTAFGWVEARIVQVNGIAHRVRLTCPRPLLGQVPQSYCEIQKSPHLAHQRANALAVNSVGA